MTIFIKKILFPILVLISLFIPTLYFITDYQKPDTGINYTLKSYKNTIALYNDQEIIKIYDNIVLNTLPANDIQNFNSGIAVTTPAQAEAYLEDFE